LRELKAHSDRLLQALSREKRQAFFREHAVVGRLRSALERIMAMPGGRQALLDGGIID
jgi:hypothetical protein